MQLAQINEPHPIFSADDTLSATVANATSITAQLTLTDAAGQLVTATDRNGNSTSYT